MSLDQPIGEQEDAVFGDLAGDDPLDEVTEKRLQKEAPRLALDVFPERDRRVLELRYGLRGEELHTLEHIGRPPGPRRERVRQIEIESLTPRPLREIEAVAIHQAASAEPSKRASALSPTRARAIRWASSRKGGREPRCPSEATRSARPPWTRRQPASAWSCPWP